METILDHHPTSEELDSLYGASDEDLLAALAQPRNEDSAFSNIAALMELRGDDAARMRYIEQIKNPRLRLDTLMLTSDLA